MVFTRKDGDFPLGFLFCIFSPRWRGEFLFLPDVRAGFLWISVNVYITSVVLFKEPGHIFFFGQFVGCLIECNTSLGQQNKHLKSVTFLVAFVGGKMFSIETPAAGWIPYNNPANFSSCPMDWVDLDRFFLRHDSWHDFCGTTGQDIPERWLPRLVHHTLMVAVKCEAQGRWWWSLWRVPEVSRSTVVYFT